MERATAITRLKALTGPVRAMGAKALYLFGSTASGTAQANSDLDVFVDALDPDSFSLVELVGIKLLLEGKLGVEVDVTTRDSLHPMLRADIEQSAIRVF